MTLFQKSALAGWRVAQSLCTVLLLACASLAHAIGPDSLFPAELMDLDGKPVSLERYRGKPLIVNFWARWCGPCRVEIPELAKVYAAHKARGLVVLGIGLEENADSARDFAKAYEMNYPLVIGDGRKTLWLMQTLGNTRGGLPFTVVISREGKLLSHKLGVMTAADLEAAAASVLR